MADVFVSASGGIDSTVLIAELLSGGHALFPFFFNYGSKHNRYEREAVSGVCRHYGLEKSLEIVNLEHMLVNDSALMAANDREIPTGCGGYNEPGSLAATVVPGRNLLMAAFLAARAEARALRTGEECRVAMGMHGGDHALYPDCREEFVRQLTMTIAIGTEGRVDFLAPRLHMTKAGIISRGFRLQAPFELTRSCYKPQATACGECGTCRERLAGFEANGKIDPIEYAGKTSSSGNA